MLGLGIGIRIGTDVVSDIVPECRAWRWATQIRYIRVHREFTSYWIRLHVRIFTTVLSLLVVLLCVSVLIHLVSNSNEHLNGTTLHNLTKALILHPIGVC